MREQPPGANSIDPRRDPLPPNNYYPDRFKNISEKERAYSEFCHLLARNLAGLPFTIAALASEARGKRDDVPKETADLLLEIEALAVRSKKQMQDAMQRALGLSDEERDRAEQHFRWTHQLPPTGARRADMPSPTGELSGPRPEVRTARRK